ncbi:MAG: hypothetical protein Kow0074_04400 [Candidatus Zixiibacteriota bacterium]
MQKDRATGARLQTWVTILLTTMVMLTSCGRRDPLEHLPTATVAAVRDGDTIELSDGRIVRYCGIDTPERGQPWYDSATALNASFVLGKTVRLEQGNDRIDRYGRMLAFVFVEDRMVNLELLKAGMAWCYFFDGNLKYGPEMVRATRRAMQDKRGMWRRMPAGDEAYYVGSHRGFRFHRPTCRSVGQIKLDDLRRFPARDSAFYAGYSPCKNCQP